MSHHPSPHSDRRRTPKSTPKQRHHHTSKIPTPPKLVLESSHSLSEKIEINTEQYIDPNANLTKLCKYFLMDCCRNSDAECAFSHNVNRSQYISARNMEPSISDILHISQLTLQNPQIQYLNMGRNGLSGKMAMELASLLSDQSVRLRKLSLDSTTIGRAGFLCILEAAAHSQYLRVLDLSDTNIMPQRQSPRNRRKSKKKAKTPTKAETEMAAYKRKEVIDALVTFMNESKTVRHLLVGHNDFSFEECLQLASAAAENGFISLDLFGSRLSDCENDYFRQMLVSTRTESIKKTLIKECDLIDCVADLVCQFGISADEDCIYRCDTWQPRRSSHPRNDRSNQESNSKK